MFQDRYSLFRMNTKASPETLHYNHGGGLFHSKGTWGCAAPKGTIFRTSSLAKGIRLGNVSLGKGMLFGNFGQRLVKFW